MNRTRLPISLIILVIFCFSCSAPTKYEIVIKNINLFDGEENKGIVNIGINRDSIACISTETIIGDSIIDGASKYIIPGLINAHVHVNKKEDLQSGYTYGILTMFNMHTGLEDREQSWKALTQDAVGLSVLYGAGHAATVPGGHPNQFSPDMETINDSITIEQWVDNRIAKGVDYIKIVRDNHSWMGRPPLPTLTYEQIGKIIEYAHSKGYLAVVHAVHADDFLEIAKYKPDGFVHMWDYKENSSLTDEQYQVIANSGAFIVPTSGISLKAKHMELPPFVKNFLDEEILSLEERTGIIKKLHDAGVMIVAGTDAQEGQMNFGEDYYFELEIYEKSGLSTIEVLRTATGNAGKAFKMPVGILSVGSKASFIILNNDPLENLKNVKEINQIWKNGVSE